MFPCGLWLLLGLFAFVTDAYYELLYSAAVSLSSAVVSLSSGSMMDVSLASTTTSTMNSTMVNSTLGINSTQGGTSVTFSSTGSEEMNPNNPKPNNPNNPN